MFGSRTCSDAYPVRRVRPQDIGCTDPTGGLDAAGRVVGTPEAVVAHDGLRVTYGRNRDRTDAVLLRDLCCAV